jgi:hypothetical protein
MVWTTILTTVPNYLLGIVIIAFAVALAIAGLLLVRRLVPLEVLESHHEVAGAKFQVMGTLYAVLFAFVIIVTWQQFQEVSMAVDLEAITLADLFRDAAEYPEATRVRFRSQLRTYAEIVVADEWEAMGRGEESRRAWEEYDKLWDIYRQLRVSDFTGIALQIETIRRMNELGEHRRLRLLHSKAEIPPVLWFSLAVGSMLTVSFSYFFGTKRLGSQLLMMALFAGGLALLVVIIVVLDQPFKGYGRISPEPFIQVLARFRLLGD